ADRAQASPLPQDLLTTAFHAPKKRQLRQMLHHYAARDFLLCRIAKALAADQSLRNLLSLHSLQRRMEFSQQHDQHQQRFLIRSNQAGNFHHNLISAIDPAENLEFVNHVELQNEFDWNNRSLPP